VLRAFIYFSLHMDMLIALLPGMEFRDSRTILYLRSDNVNLETQKKIVSIENLTKTNDEKSSWYKDFRLTTSSKDLMASQEYTFKWRKMECDYFTVFDGSFM
jgi:hypothetical protein